jgi:hypothetical protein
VLGQAAEAQQQPAVGGSGQVQRRQCGEADAAGGGRFGQGGVVDPAGQRQEKLHAGGGTADPEPGEPGGEGVQQQVAPTPVDVPGPDDVPFVFAGGQQAGQRELVDGR